MSSSEDERQVDVFKRERKFRYRWSYVSTLCRRARAMSEQPVLDWKSVLRLLTDIADVDGLRRLLGGGR